MQNALTNTKHFLYHCQNLNGGRQPPLRRPQHFKNAGQDEDQAQGQDQVQRQSQIQRQGQVQRQSQGQRQGQGQRLSQVQRRQSSNIPSGNNF
jgi:hypothetical protein